MTKKQEVGPLQADEVSKIRKSVAEFDRNQELLQKKFRSMEAFQFSCKNPYQHLDEVKLPPGLKSLTLTIHVRRYFAISLDVSPRINNVE